MHEYQNLRRTVPGVTGAAYLFILTMGNGLQTKFNNKKTPLPLPDEVQDQLAGSTIFSTLDL